MAEVPGAETPSPAEVLGLQTSPQGGCDVPACGAALARPGTVNINYYVDTPAPGALRPVPGLPRVNDRCSGSNRWTELIGATGRRGPSVSLTLKI